MFLFEGNILNKYKGLKSNVLGHFSSNISRRQVRDVDTRKNIFRGECSNQRKFKTNLGFSLIELIIVIAIMAVLVGLIAPAFGQQVENKRKQTCKENRLAILNIYARCVFDTSVSDVVNNTASLGKIFPTSSDKSTHYGVTFQPVANEVGNYIKVSNSEKHNMYDSANMTYGVDTTTGTAWIECSECGDRVSLDLTGWSPSAAPKSTDAPVATPNIPTPTPEATPGLCYVTFNVNGHGTFTDENPQEVEYGKTARKPDSSKISCPTFDFKGWYKESSCINEYNFSSVVTSDITLYAKWEGKGAPNFWPYATDKDWWELNPDGSYDHAGDVKGYQLAKPGVTTDAMYVNMPAPSGIFTSRAGNQFVLVEASGTFVKIEYKNADSPEFFSAMYPNYLIQLTGQEYTIDITNISSGEVYLPIRTNGDMVKIVDGGATYEYVYWHSGLEDAKVNVSQLRSYATHPGNMYRVNSSATY